LGLVLQVFLLGQGVVEKVLQPVGVLGSVALLEEVLEMPSEQQVVALVVVHHSIVVARVH
jgi:hypothetical protein